MAEEISTLFLRLSKSTESLYVIQNSHGVYTVSYTGWIVNVVVGGKGDV